MGYYALLTFASTSPHTHEIHIGQNQNNRVLQLAFPHSRPSQALAAHRPGHKHLWTHSDLSRSNANGKVIKQSRTTNSRLIAGHRRKSSSLLTQFVRTGARKHPASIRRCTAERSSRKMGSTANVHTAAPKSAASVRSRMLPGRMLHTGGVGSEGE